MSPPTSRPAVAILGGGMAGVTAAWELSRPGWESRVRSITLYQRDGLLGGKGASVRDAQGRILEHGLHVWPGYYDNAFRVVRECYEELDRAVADPECPVRTWADAFTPAPAIGVYEHVDGTVVPWLARFRLNDGVPGSARPSADLAALTRRVLGLVQDLFRSAGGRTGPRVEIGVDLALTVGRGLRADGLLHERGGFGRVDHEDFRAWLRRHGASPATVESGIVRAMYDLVFGYADGDKARPAFPAGLGVYLAIRMFLDYQGALFWKMTAGMGDIVFAPMHQALTARGVALRYFHAVEEIVPDASGGELREIRITRPRDHDRAVDPLERVGGIPCFVDRPPPAGPRETVVLRQGVDFDTAVLAASLGAVPVVAPRLVAQRPEWRAMVEHVGTVRTRAAQVWLRDPEPALGWPEPGATFAGLDAPLDTVASMSHLLPVEARGATGPATLAYLCSVAPDTDPAPDVGAVLDDALRAHGRAVWPAGGPRDAEDPQIVDRYLRLNDDPSDRYVQALPGADLHRLRVDGSGVRHLILAGDWTDCGLNAGCIEGATISGIEAAAAVEGRPLTDRVLGPLTWDWQ